MKLRIQGNKMAIEGQDNMVSKLLTGTKGKIKIRTPFEEREVKIVNKLTKK